MTTHLDAVSAPRVNTPVGGAPVVPLILFAAGGYLLWFGSHYWKDGTTKWPTGPVKAVLTGKPIPKPAAGAASTAQATLAADIKGLQPDPATSSGGGGGAAGGGAVATSSAIANDAQKYIGQGYHYAGPSKPGQWDCSSFVSYVLGHDLGMNIPGGSWATVTSNGTQHGPASGTYMLFGTGVTQGTAKAGDLIATTDHIGIIVSSTQMVSAQDEQLGTGLGNWPAGFPGGPPVYRRVSSG